MTLCIGALWANDLSLLRRCLPERKDWLANRLYAPEELVVPRGDTDMIAYLLTLGTLLDTELWRDFLEKAIYLGRHDMVTFLWDFKKERQPNIQDLGTFLFIQSLRTPDLDVLKFLEEQRRLHQGPSSASLAHSATDFRPRCIREGRLDTLAYGVDHLGWPLRPESMELAAEAGHLHIMEFLFERGASCRIQAVWAAAEFCPQIEVLRWLLERVVPRELDTTLALASFKGRLDFVRLLLDAEAGRKEEAKEAASWIGGYGRPGCLQNAIRHENAAMFELFLARGARFDLAKKKCLDIAKKEGFESMVILLKQHGADDSEEQGFGYARFW